MSLEIPIRADIDPLKGDLNKAVQIVSSAGDQFAASATKASMKAKGGIDAINASSMSLQQKFRALQKEAFTLGDRYGVMSTQALAASKAAGELKKELDDARIAVKILSDDTPMFTALTGTLQGVAGGFSVVTGAMGLLGAESEEVQKLLLKVQSALAITQGLASLNQLNDSFAALKVVISTSVIPAIKSLDMATKATLIGAIGGAVALLAVYIMDMNEAADATERMAQAQETASKSLDDYKAAVKTASDANKAVRDLEIESMKEGAAKDKALLAEKMLNLRQEVDERFKASNQTTYDARRRAASLIAIAKIEANELLAIQKKYKKEAFDYRGFNGKQTVGIIPSFVTTGVTIQRGMAQLSENVRRFVKPIPIDTFITPPKKTDMQIFTNNLIIEFQSMGEKLKQAGAQIGASAAFAIGQSFGSQEFDFGQAMLQQLAQLMQQVGTAFIAMGIAYKATGIGAGYGALLVGAGVGLNIAAGALSASASGGGGAGMTASPAGGGGNMSAFNGGGFGNSFEGTSRIQGKDLIMVFSRQDSFNKRG